MSPLRRLTPEVREALAAALGASRIAAPFSELAVARYVGKHHAEAVSIELQRLAALGMAPAHIKEILDVLGADGVAGASMLVWSGPEGAGAQTRDTAVVVRELFNQARGSVVVAGFAVYQGRSVFEVLSRKMDQQADLAVRMFLNVERRWGNTSAASQILREFAERFRAEEWPGHRLPEVYYDPRALAPRTKKTRGASLHAKCVVVDAARALVTSANFTEAAQERNIEVGVLIEDEGMCRALVQQFDGLVAAGSLVPVPGLC